MNSPDKSLQDKKVEEGHVNATFEGGDLDGKTVLLDNPRPTLVICDSIKPDGFGIQKTVKSLYKIESEGPPLKYKHQMTYSTR